MSDKIRLVTVADEPHQNGHSPNGTSTVESEDDITSFADESGVPWNKIRAFPLDEVGNATRIRCYFGDDLLYCKDANGWFVWDGRRWVLDRKDYVTKLMTRTVQTIFQEAMLVGKGELVTPVKEESKVKVVEAILKWGNKSRNAYPIKGSIQLAQHLLPVLREDFDTEPFLFNAGNGMIDLKTGELLPHDRTKKLTQLCSVEYDPEAIYPKWNNFLFSVFEGDMEMLDYIQRLAGYCLTGNTRERSFFILYGSGRNGKSTFLNTLMKVLAEYGQEIQAESLAASQRNAGSASPDLAKLKGARLVSASESEENRRLAEAQVKRMTGGSDKITAAFKYENETTFTPEFKLFLATNHRPEIRGTDQGIWDRVHLIPFANRFWDPDRGESGPDNLKVNKNLETELAEELPGILRWMVDGCLKWQQQGLKVPAKVRAATNEYRAESDTLANFIEEFCVVQNFAHCTKKEMYEEYTKWSAQNGMEAISKPRFSKQMKERGIKDSRPGGVHQWNGIGLASQGQMDLNE